MAVWKSLVPSHPGVSLSLPRLFVTGQTRAEPPQSDQCFLLNLMAHHRTVHAASSVNVILISSRSGTPCIKGASSLLINFCSAHLLFLSAFFLWWRCDGTSVDRSLSRGSYIGNPIKDVYEAASQREEEIETQQRRGSWCTPSRDIPLILCAAESVPWQLQLIQCQTQLLHTPSERNSGRKHKLSEHTGLWESRRMHKGQCWQNLNMSVTHNPLVLTREAITISQVGIKIPCATWWSNAGCQCDFKLFISHCVKTKNWFLERMLFFSPTLEKEEL